MKKVTKAPKIKKELAHVDFEGMEAVDIEAIFRAIGHQVQEILDVQNEKESTVTDILA
jgi:hypothetical protein